jgi:two-component system NarL family response regulator
VVAEESKLEPATVLVIDDHALFLRGARSVIDHDKQFEVAGVAASGPEALARARELRPDLILLDISLSDGSGLPMIDAIKQELANTKIVVLTVQDDEWNLFESIKRGVDGFLSKDVRADVLLQALRCVVKGEAAISGRVAAKLLHEFARLARAESSNRTAQLTPREEQILLEISAGRTVQEIASALQLSESAIRVHVAQALKRLHLGRHCQTAACSK